MLYMARLVVLARTVYRIIQSSNPATNTKAYLLTLGLAVLYWWFVGQPDLRTCGRRRRDVLRRGLSVGLLGLDLCPDLVADKAK